MMMRMMPSGVDEHVGFFDRFASRVAKVASEAPFFAFCLLLVVIWAPSYFVLRDLNLWQLIINTATTIITFLLVALLQNTEARADQAVQHKLNAIADALGNLMEHLAAADGAADLLADVIELRAAVGLEERESTS